MEILLSDVVSKNNNEYIFQDTFDSFLLSEKFIYRYGKYVPFFYKFVNVNDTIFYPHFEKGFFKTVETITLSDMMNQNYTALDLMIKNGKIFVFDGKHRILRFTVLCLDNNIKLNKVSLRFNIIKDF